jgi:phosphoribosylanthranilate isomerase
MTWIKICGMTNLEDALVAVDAGADAVGFVFYEKSPRFVSVETAREIVAKLPENVEKVGVFVGNSKIEFGTKFMDVGLTALQFYGFAQIEKRSESTQPKAFGMSLFPTLRKWFVALPARYFLEDNENAVRWVANIQQLKKIRTDEANFPEGMYDTCFLDSGTAKMAGGTGETFSWQDAVSPVQILQQGGVKVVVAGGLSSENVVDAIGILKPWGVDVSSGVEAGPGKKDPEKVRAFVKAVREMDGKVSDARVS